MDGHLLRAQLQARDMVVRIQHDTTSVVRRKRNWIAAVPSREQQSSWGIALKS
jgi:hypothetical protein